ncbi:vacuolar membrane-associated protein iml1, partial [Thoreauomyces humboldtii]
MRGFQATPGKTSSTAASQRTSYNLWVHDDRFSRLDIIINPDCFPNVRPGDLLKITQPNTNNPPAKGDNITTSTADLSAAGNSPSQQRSKLSNATSKPVPRGTPAPVPHSTTGASAGERARTLVLQVTSLDREINAKQPQLQISIAQHIAALFELHPRKDVIVRKIDKEPVAADYVELSFRDQYVGRSDMWRLRTVLTGTCVYEGKKVLSLGIRAQIKDIVVAGKRASCGYITENTKTIFRSETAKYFIFIQMSKEMWEFDEDGELYFEKCVHGFLPQLFAKWKDAGSNHVVSIVLFARIYYPNNEREREEASASSFFEDEPHSEPGSSISILVDAAGRHYRDFFKVVVDWETRSDWSQVLIPLKKEFISFQRDVLQQPGGDGSTILAGANSPASDGNILEAINLALNPFDRHYIDRDLSRTGLSIVVVTPGPGVFEADKKLLRLTAQRMVDNGIGLDLVCLSKPPLCTVPLFQYVSKDWAGAGPGWGVTSSGASTDVDNNASGERRWGPAAGAKPGDRMPEKSGSSSGAGIDRKLETWDPLYFDDSSPDNPDKTFFTVPHWVMCSFWTRDDESDRMGFTLRCKMYEVQMMGVMEQIGSTIVIPYLDDPNETKSHDDSTSSKGRKDSLASTVPVLPGVVRFEIGADDDEDSPAMSVVSDGHIDIERYDEKVFSSGSRGRAGLTKNRSSSVVNMGGAEPDASPSIRGSRSAVRVDSQHQLSVTGIARVPLTGGATTSVSPEVSLTHNYSSGTVSRATFHRSTTGDTVRSIDSDTQPSRGGAFQSTPYYQPWEDGDTMNADERLALLRAKQRIEHARAGNAAGASAHQVRNTPSATSLSALFAHPPKPVREESNSGSDVTGPPRPGWPPGQQQRTAGSGSRKGSLVMESGGSAYTSKPSESRVHAHLASVTVYEPTTDRNLDPPPRPRGVVEEEEPGSTTLAPIRIRSTSHLGVRQPYRDVLSTSGSFKSHSPLANYEYLRSQHKLSPGKPGGASTGASRAPSQSNFRPNLINPCNPSRNVVRATSQVLRWQHVFPQVIVPTRNDIVIHWKSLSTPACLPLTTDFFPTHEDLSEFYQEYTYTVSPADDATPYQSRGQDRLDIVNGRIKVEALLIELIGQRLSQGFQLIGAALGGSVNVGDRSDSPSQSLVSSSPQLTVRSAADLIKRMPGAAESPQRQGGPLVAGGAQRPGISALQTHQQSSQEIIAQSVASNPYYLSLGDHVHKLSYDASGQNVEVKRYVRKVTYSTLPIHYACGIWRKNDGSYRPRQLTFTHPPVTLYNWNYLDHLISGYQEELTENLRFWRTRFLLIPLESVGHMNTFLNPHNEDLDEEEVRVVGFEKFIEVFERARWRQPWEEEDADSHHHGPSHTSTAAAAVAVGKKKKGMKFGKKLQIQLTTLNTSRFIKDEVLRRGLVYSEVASPASAAHSPPHQPHIILARRGSTVLTPVSAGSSSPSSSPALVTSPVPLTRASYFSIIAQAMQAPPPAGVPFGDRRWHFRLYESVLIGSEAVDWMVRNFADIDSREDAVDFGNHLLKEGFLEHANRKHKFLDGHYFYRVRGEFSSRPSAVGNKEKDKVAAGGGGSGALWFGARGKSTVDLTAVESNAINSVVSPSTSTGTSATTTTTANTTPTRSNQDSNHPPSAKGTTTGSPVRSLAVPPPRPNPFALTRRMVIDLDPQRRSPRRETALLHYDTLHNPRHCYHFQLHWLVCSPRWIEDLVAGWTRVAEKCGFKMVEAGTTQADLLSDDNPFQSMTHIVPCVAPPIYRTPPNPNLNLTVTHTTTLPTTLYLTEIVRRFNFVLDVESDTALPDHAVTWSYDRGNGYSRTQYVHRSGVAFVQIAGEKEG